MSCRIVQTLPPHNEGERRMLAFLKRLPAHYTLIGELQVNTSFYREVEGQEKKTPDFVIIATDVGVLSIEVKDWNLNDYIYVWENQYELTKRDRRTNEVRGEGIKAPNKQVDDYLHGLQSLVRHGLDLNTARQLWVSSVLAFPLLTRTAFLDGVVNRQLLTGPQGRFYADLDRILFKEDLDRHADHPERLLCEIVRRDHRFKQASEGAIYRVNELLVPSKCRIGGDEKLQQARMRLEVLSEQQSRWAFSLDPDENYLLDVAGSGKTNALISKAMHLADQARGQPPATLITTYNRNLEQSLRRILREKIGDSSSGRYGAIQVLSVPTLLELIIKRGYGDDALREICRAARGEDAYLGCLLKEAIGVIREAPEQFRRFDHVFIDEIQDFSNDFLRIVKQFAKGSSFFFVGDIGQKIYRRSYDLERLGLTLNRKELEKSYLMYRTPRYIAELATRFILADSQMKREFKAYGYDQNFSYPNTLAHGAELSRTTDQVGEVAVCIRKLLESTYPGGEHQILVVASPERLEATRAALERVGIACRIGEEVTSDAVVIVDFRDSKGLEREVVVVLGVEDLYHEQSEQALFDEPSDRWEKESLDRRKLYVALTRATERLYLFYSDRTHPFVGELCDLNDHINRTRQKG